LAHWVTLKAGSKKSESLPGAPEEISLNFQIPFNVSAWDASFFEGTKTCANNILEQNARQANAINGNRFIYSNVTKAGI
jgi:hypothetical protein